MTQAMGGYYGAAYGPLGASMAAAAAAAAQQNAISAALTPNAQVDTYKHYVHDNESDDLSGTVWHALEFEWEVADSIHATGLFRIL